MAEKNIPLFSYQKYESQELETSMEMLLEVQSPGKGENNRAIKGRPHPSSLSLSQEPFPLDWDPFKLCMMAWNRDWDFARKVFSACQKKEEERGVYGCPRCIQRYIQCRRTKRSAGRWLGQTWVYRALNAQSPVIQWRIYLEVTYVKRRVCDQFMKLWRNYQTQHRVVWLNNCALWIKSIRPDTQCSLHHSIPLIFKAFSWTSSL